MISSASTIVFFICLFDFPLLSVRMTVRLDVEVMKFSLVGSREAFRSYSQEFETITMVLNKLSMTKHYKEMIDFNDASTVNYEKMFGSNLNPIAHWRPYLRTEKTMLVIMELENETYVVRLQAATNWDRLAKYEVGDAVGATSPTVAKYAKTGCSDKCGNVRIPYPFGIEAGCSINHWYTIDCKSSKPYLSAFQLEVLSIGLEDQIVTVSMPNNRAVNGMDLSTSPFLFSKMHNTFMFEGCGVAIMINNGRVVTGCSTTCLNVTLSDSDRSKCDGNRCCQTYIPHYFESYNIILEKQGEDGGSAFLLDEASYEYGSLFDPFILKNASSISVSLLWTLRDSDRVTCCGNKDPERLTVDMFNNTSLETRRCSLNIFSDNPYVVDGCTMDGDIKDAYSRISIPKYAKTGCNDMCGNVRIPFPFGMHEHCALNHWYIVNCTSFKPYLTALNNLEVLGVHLKNHTITIKTPRITNCHNSVMNSSEIMGIDLDMSPFWFSKYHNKFVFEGCGTAALMDNGTLVTTCSTACVGVTLSDINNCFGIGCCETTISSYDLKSYSISLGGLNEEYGGCGSAFLADESSYEEGRFSDPFIVKNTSFIPVSLMWALTGSDDVTCYGNTRENSGIYMFNGSILDSWICYSDSYLEGNPYLVDGCKYIGSGM
ncbi:hypothetical protein QVD17_37378 [Tagetes erecta]|uniref:Uncharacterized protein n=1 Tax=Tagetes erecta TaxID=13708 RepID=A0AAD8NJ46_TARER|nr:hypothetical protein QVD17_37378 [Tagetes erecta]